MKHILIVFLISILSVHTIVGQPTQAEQRIINSAVLNVCEDYINAASLYSEENRSSLINVFINPEANCLFNDFFFSIRYRDLVSPISYVQEMPTDGSIIYDINYSDLRLSGRIEKKGDYYLRKVHVNKSVTIIDSRFYKEKQGGVIFSLPEIYDGVECFVLEIECRYNPRSNECLIESVKEISNLPPSIIDTERYSVLVKSNEKYDNKLRQNGSELLFNSFDQVFVNKSALYLHDKDVRIKSQLKAKANNYEVIEFAYKAKSLRTKVRSSFSLGKALSVKSEEDTIKSKSFAFEYGVDFGYMFSLAKGKIGLYSGVAMSVSSLSLKTAPIVYSYPEEITGADSRKYARNYHIDSITEDIKYNDIMIPLYVSYESRLSDLFRINLDLGAKLYLPLSTKNDPLLIDGYTFGVYNDEEIITEDADNAFGRLPERYSEYASLNQLEYNRRSTQISLFASAGVDLKIFNDIYGFCSVSYEYGLNKIHNKMQDRCFDKENGIFPLIYDTQLKNDVVVNPIYGAVNVARRSLWASIGVKLIF